MSKSKFPTSEGWLHIKMEMTTSKPRSEEEIKKIAAFGRPPEAYEWGLVEQHGKKIHVIYRPLRTPALPGKTEESAPQN